MDDMMTEVNLKECCIHPVTYAQTLMNRAEAAEAQRDEYKRQWVEATTELENIGESWPQLKAERDELAAQLATAQAEIKTMATELNRYHKLQADIDMGVVVLEYPAEDEVEP